MSTKEKGHFLSFGNSPYSLGSVRKWDEHNQEVLKGEIIGITDENTSITKNCIVKVNQTACHDFDQSTDQLKLRARHIFYWKAELERAISDINEEIAILEEQRQQLLNAMDTLNIPQSITKECLEIRSNRMESDLTHDSPQEALFVEATLIDNIKQIQHQAFRDIEHQMAMNIAAKEQLERDWSNKKYAYNLEDENVHLETKSENVKDNSGVAKFYDGQSNIDLWEQNTVNMLNQFKSAIDKSKSLRKHVEAMLINTARDLRSQDMKVNNALAERIAQTEKVKTDLESQLRITLDKIAETENILETLHDEIMKVRQRMQVAQTRLTIKSYRPTVENCREGSLITLIEEVKDLNDSLSLLENRCLETEKIRAKLIEDRSKIENEINVKKKTIYLDNQRCLYIRSYYQSAEKLTGH